jgi:hypothetical protein
MNPFEVDLLLVVGGMIAGAVLWHFVHAKVAADIAALKADVENLKTSAAAKVSTAVASVVPAAVKPAAPAAPAAPATPAASTPAS